MADSVHSGKRNNTHHHGPDVMNIKSSIKTSFKKLFQSNSKQLRRRFKAWLHRVGVVRKAALILTLLATASGIGTYATLANAGPTGPDPKVVLGLLYLNLGLLLILGALVAQRLVALWFQRRKGLAGSQLHIRLVMLFSVVAVTPTIVVVVFSVLLFDFGIRSWFSERIGSAVDASHAVAEAYLAEHRENIRGDVLAMANDLNRDVSILLSNPNHLNKVIRAQAAIRNLSEVVVFEGSGKVLARTGLSLTFDFDPFPEESFQSARAGEVATITGDADRIRAIVRLDRFVDAYLYAGRFVEPDILAYIDTTKKASAQYRKLEGERFDIQLTFALIFAVVALLLLFAAIWVGLNLATRLARPISELVTAAEKVSEGDLSARVAGDGKSTELSTLTRAFNRMARQVAAQRGDLIRSHKEQNARRQFTEAVLGGVSAGVIGLDQDGKIHLPNRSAAHLLNMELSELTDQKLSEILPEMSDLLTECRTNPMERAEAQVSISREDKTITLLSRISAETSDDLITGFVLTFDDVSELQSAQRMAAWADVARRIAHEMKNPLTPIQLSAERLKRKYRAQIKTETDTFDSLTDTIIRQVGDIGGMVDEFSSFARMPTAVFKDVDIGNLLIEQISLQEAAHPLIQYTFSPFRQKLWLCCDGRQMRQAVTNLLQNAADSIDAKKQVNTGFKGSIRINITSDNGHLSINIADNGRGLPIEDRDRLTEPYVTTRAKGTGLGLAIVTKIMEDHGGKLRLRDGKIEGAEVTMQIPLVSSNLAI